MSRRSSPQAKQDDLAFPVRLKLTVPPMGLGKLTDAIDDWLRREVGPGDYASHSAPGIAGSTAAIYFRRAEDAAAFTAAFPQAELADGTLSPAYRGLRRQ